MLLDLAARVVQHFYGGRDDGRSSRVSRDLSVITSDDELGLIKVMANWPRIIEGAAQAREPHRIAFALMDLAASFHGLWNQGNDNAALRFIVPDDKT